MLAWLDWPHCVKQFPRASALDFLLGINPVHDDYFSLLCAYGKRWEHDVASFSATALSNLTSVLSGVGDGPSQRGWCEEAAALDLEEEP